METLQGDCDNYNVYQPGRGKEIIRSLTQEINLATCLTQLSHTPAEYAKGMMTLLDQILKNLKAKNDDIERAHINIQKLSSALDKKEMSLVNLEREIDKIQNKEIELNKKREEIFQ